MRGPKPQSTETKRLAGNPGQRRLNDAEPIPDDLAWTTPAELVDVPAALAEWNRLVPLLRKCRQITEADRTPLVAVCLEWARYLDAMQAVRKAGLIVPAPNGYPMTSPYLPIAMKALASCTRLWPELGLTPSSRSRVQAAPTTPAEDARDPFAEFDDAPRRPVS